jgi:[acyl-carrier-protein] S-malonyltransferase
MRFGFVFPGQGAQKVGMGKDLFDEYPEVRALFQKAEQYLKKDIGRICFEGPPEELVKTENAQVAIFLVSVAILEQLRVKGIKPEIVAGHSLGEISAYYAAGVFELEQALDIIRERGQAMANSHPAEDSGMAAVLKLDEEIILEVVAPMKDVPVCIANYNSPGQIVITGKKEGVLKASDILKEKGAKIIPLNVSGAFHSPLMVKGAQVFQNYLDGVTLNKAGRPIILNRTAQIEREAGALKQNLVEQIKSPVRWMEAVKNMAQKVDVIVECGPGKVLSGLIKKIDPEIEVLNVSDVDSLSKIDLAQNVQA